MAEDPVCEELRDLLIDHRNGLITAQVDVYDVRDARDQSKRRVSDLENQISNARLMNMVTTIPRKTTGLVGAVVGMAGEFRASRLERELVSAKADLVDAEKRLVAMEEKIRSHESGIGITERELLSRGCD